VRPAADAGADAWRDYALELEAIVAAAEKRGNFLHGRLNEIVSSPAWKMLRQAKRILDKAPGRKSSRTTVKSAQLAAAPAISGQPLVSILIPFRDGAKWLERCLKSIRAKSTYAKYELVLIDNGSQEKATERLLEREKLQPNVSVLRVDEPFNYARLNNLGARQAKGEHLLLLNNDTEVLEPHWIQALLEHSQRSDVGAVGAKLLYSDGRIQHAGIVLGTGDVADPEHRLADDADPAVNAVRECPAVTAACMMTRRALFEELGGLDEKNLPVAYNDVDYCLRLRERGLRIVYTPFAKLTHHESLSRGLLNDPAQAAYMCRRWAKELTGRRGDGEKGRNGDAETRRRGDAEKPVRRPGDAGK
jgi:GT2 family glycosyltransferase